VGMWECGNAGISNAGMWERLQDRKVGRKQCIDSLSPSLACAGMYHT
jgi:hypothetical protein